MPVACRQALKKAVLVGVNYSTNDNLSYHGFLEQPGAHKDTQRLHKLLTTKYGYKDEDITVLIDSDAWPLACWPTRENIVKAMEELVAGTQRGDHIVFSFSGHGGQVEAREDQLEEDGQDEVLLAIDSTYDPEGHPDRFSNFIRDDDIRRILVKNLPDGVRCVMIFDCCHSGTASDLPSVKDCLLSPITPTSPLTSPGLQSRAFVQMQTVHDETPPPYLWPSARAANVYPPSRRGSVMIEKEKDVTSWSACLDDQVTFGQRSGGIFIKAFTNALSTFNNQGGIHKLSHATFSDSHPNPTHHHLLQSLRKELDLVTVEANRKRRMRGREDDSIEPYMAPRPQLGSLRPDTILHAEFTL